MKTHHLALLLLPAFTPALACGGSSAHANSSSGGIGSNIDQASVGGAPGGSAGVDVTGGANAGGANAGAAAGGSAGAAGAAAGGGGQAHAGSGGQSTGGAAQSSNPACQQPTGTEVQAQDYTLPSGCLFRPQFGDNSFTLTEEASFKSKLDCPPEVASGIDFASKRLRVAIYPAAGTALRTFAVEADTVVVGLSATSWCGGAAPPNQVTLTLLPASAKLIEERLCMSGCNFGAGGFLPP